MGAYVDHQANICTFKSINIMSIRSPRWTFLTLNLNGTKYYWWISVHVKEQGKKLAFSPPRGSNSQPSDQLVTDHPDLRKSLTLYPIELGGR